MSPRRQQQRIRRRSNPLAPRDKGDEHGLFVELAAELFPVAERHIDVVELNAGLVLSLTESADAWAPSIQTWWVWKMRRVRSDP
jgi:hypothetical protein